MKFAAGLILASGLLVHSLPTSQPGAENIEKRTFGDIGADIEAVKSNIGPEIEAVESNIGPGIEAVKSIKCGFQSKIASKIGITLPWCHDKEPSSPSLPSYDLPTSYSPPGYNKPSAENIEKRTFGDIGAVTSNIGPEIEAVTSNIGPEIEAVKSNIGPSIEAVKSNIGPSIEAVKSNIGPSIEAVKSIKCGLNSKFGINLPWCSGKQPSSPSLPGLDLLPDFSLPGYTEPAKPEEPVTPPKSPEPSSAPSYGAPSDEAPSY